VARGTSPDGELVLLGDQDRSRWDGARIAEGCARVERALASRRFGPVHAAGRDRRGARRSASRRRHGLDADRRVYDVLARVDASPVVRLNRAVAVAMRDGPAAGLALVDALLADGALDAYHLAHAARADLCRRLGRHDEARAAYQRALALARQAPERRFLARRLAELRP
jgi:RNA polymerase sigma-70 factor (ECF subfamily)